MTRFPEAWKAPFALEGSEMLARRKRFRERGTGSVLELDSRPERVLEQGSPKVRCINNHRVSIQQLTVFLGFVSKMKSIGPPGRLTLGLGSRGGTRRLVCPWLSSFNPLGSSQLRNLYIPPKTAKNLLIETKSFKSNLLHEPSL